MSLAFVADDLVHHAAAFVTQDADGVLTCRVFGEADPDRVVAQVRRVLSLDQSGSAWAEVGGRDPVIGRLQSELPGPPSGALPFAVRGGRLVDPQPAQAPDPGNRGAQAARPRRTARSSPSRVAELEAFPHARGAASGRVVPQPGTAAHRPPPRGCSGRARRTARPGAAACDGAGGGDGRTCSSSPESARCTRG